MISSSRGLPDDMHQVGTSSLEKQKICYDIIFSCQEGRTARHLTNGGNLTGPAGEDTGRLF